MKERPLDRLITAPTAEILTLAAVKEHLRISSQSYADDVTRVSSIAPGSHAIGAAAGIGVDVSDCIPLVVIDSRTNGDGGTVIIKIQDSADNATYTDWYTFATITTSTDNAFFEYEYTGGKQYIRAYYTAAGAACEFGVNVEKKSPLSADDSFLTSKIASVRQFAEEFQGRAYYTQTREMILQEWPCEDYIKILYPPLQSITSIKYYDSAGTEYTFSTSYYDVAVYGKDKGMVTLKYGEIWPSETLRPSEPIIIRYVCGFTSSAEFKKYLSNAHDWMLVAIERLWRNRDLTVDELNARALIFDKVEWC